MKRMKSICLNEGVTEKCKIVSGGCYLVRDVA